MEVKKIFKDLYLLDPTPPIEGFEGFLASYILLGDKVLIFETGPACAVNGVLDGLREVNIPPEDVLYVVVSHIHIDHAGGAGTLLKYLPNAKLVVHEKGVPHMVDPQKLWESTKKALGSLAEAYGLIEPIPAERIVNGVEGLVLNLGEECKVKVLETPGHAPHHLSLYREGTGEVFLGEAGGVYIQHLDALRPSTPPPGFNFTQSLASLEKIKKLNPKRLCYTHFGFTDKVEKLDFYSEKLRLWVNMALKGYKEGKTSVDVFNEILAVDGDAKKLAKHERERFFMINSVEGMIFYLKKYGYPGENIKN
ncbi:MAG: MBL fold metallo-hydrolase [Candidatus Bathyarchaeota archaeon]|nr:MBL fold metallo-hydrolase [Candidatus Bathyarchaeota archaeon]